MNQLNIGYFLKELREEKVITQEKLAEILGVSNRTVSRWENGRNMPDLSALVQLTELYGVKLSEIVAGERESKDSNMEEKDKQAIKQLVQMYRSEKYDFSQKLNWILILGAVCSMGLYLDFGDELNKMCMSIMAGTSVVACLINSLYLLYGKRLDRPVVGIDEKVMLCTYKDTLSGVGGYLIVAPTGMKFLPHNLNTRKENFECSFEDIDEMTIGNYKMIRNLLLIKKQGEEHRFLLEKKDREEMLKIYTEWMKR